MAIDVTSQQFVLPRGPDASEQFLKTSQTLLQMKMLKDAKDKADAEKKEQKRNVAGNFLHSYLDPKQYLNGSEYDPVVVQKLNDVMQKASGLAEQGADIPSLLMSIGPDMQEVSQYSTKAKVIDQNIKDNLAKIKDYKGYNQDAILDEAKRSAFHEIDPKTGEYGALKDINKVDPSVNYVMQAIKDHPETTTTGAGLEDFISKVPMKEYTKSVQTAFGGRTKNVNYDARHPFYMDLQRDDNGQISTDKNGNPVGLDVQADIVHGDDGKPLKDPDTGQAYRALNLQDYRQIMGLHPDIADHMRAEVKNTYQQLGQPMPAEGSQAWELMARHVLYGALKNNDKSHFKTNEVQRETAPAVKLDLGSAYTDILRNEAKARKEGNLEAQDEAGAGTGAKAKPLNVAQTTNEIFNNNPDYIKGESTKVDGHRVIDVTGSYQGAEFRFGHGEQQAYDKVYYDPQRRVLITQDKSEQRTEHKESDMPDFLQKVAGANKLNPSAIPKYLAAGGYSKGRYGKPGDASGTIQDLNDADVNEKRKALDDLYTNGKATALKGIYTPAGKIEKAEESGWFDPGKYYIKIEGKKDKIPFKSKQAFEEYILQNKTQEPATVAPAPTPTKDGKTEKALDDLINKYSK